jgi:Zn ribbon nucleic-acid-binding protein
MAGDTKSHHQFVVSNDAGVVIRCCIHCGLSHQMETYQVEQPNKPDWIWTLILEEAENETFAEPCPGESGSDDLFPYHHFILSNHHRQTGVSVVIRFCVRCGLSHHLIWASPLTLGIEVPYPGNIHMRVPFWRYIKENEQDTTVSDLCPVEQGSDALKRRYLLIPKN